MNRTNSLHTFLMDEAFAHEDEGTATAGAANIKDAMEHVNSSFAGAIPDHRLAKAVNKILEPLGFNDANTLLTTSLCCDEVCRDLEDEFRNIYGPNHNMGGIAGFPFGGATAFGAACHHIPQQPNGRCIILYGPHVGVDYDGVIGRINRRGHNGSGSCCNTAMASLHYVKAVQSGQKIHSPDPSDPIDAQQVFVDTALMGKADRLENSQAPAEVELPHVLFECIDDLLERIIAKCEKDIPTGTQVALLGGIQINGGEGLPDYFLPKKFNLLDSKGKVVQDLLSNLAAEGAKDPRALLKERQAKKMMTEATPPPENAENLINITIDPQLPVANTLSA
jgi:hypothetical protein